MNYKIKCWKILDSLIDDNILCYDKIVIRCLHAYVIVVISYKYADALEFARKNQHARDLIAQ